MSTYTALTKNLSVHIGRILITVYTARSLLIRMNNNFLYYRITNTCTCLLLTRTSVLLRNWQYVTNRQFVVLNKLKCGVEQIDLNLNLLVWHYTLFFKDMVKASEHSKHREYGPVAVVSRYIGDPYTYGCVNQRPKCYNSFALSMR